MWPFKKKKDKVFCEECRHYIYNKAASGHQHECHFNYGKQKQITILNSPILRARTITTKTSIENAFIKNYQNDCKDYKPLFGDPDGDL